MSLVRSSLFRSLLLGFIAGATALWASQPADARAELAQAVEQRIGDWL